MDQGQRKLHRPTIHVSNRLTYSHREAGLVRSTSHETHTVGPEETLARSGDFGKSYSYSIALQPHLDWWLNKENVLRGQPLHPLGHALQIFTDALNEGWGAHLGDWS